MPTRRRITLGAWTALAAAGCTPRAVGGEPTGPNQTLAFIRDVHPDPNRFRGLEQRAPLDPGDSSGVVDPDRRGATLRMDAAYQALVASFHDAHMRPALVAFQPGVAAGLRLPPLTVEVTGDGVFVVVSSDASLVGRRLVAVDDVPIAVLMDQLAGLAIYDGNDLAARDVVLSDEFAPLTVLALGSRDTWMVEVENGTDGTRPVRLEGIGLSELARLNGRRPVGERVVGPAQAWPTFTTLEDGTALVSLPSFGNPDGAAYERHLGEMVTQLVDAPRIVIDLRHNEGGIRTHGAALLRHLVVRPFVQWRSISIVPHRQRHRWQDMMVGAFGAPLDVVDAFPGDLRHGRLRVDGDPLAAEFEPRAPYLDQPVALLVDGATRSAANEFVVGLQASRPDVLLVGEEVGETCDGHAGQFPVFFTEPSSGRMLLMSLAWIELVEVPRCEAGRGLMPDVAVPRDRAWVQQRLEGGDPDLDAAVSALRG